MEHRVIDASNEKYEDLHKDFYKMLEIYGKIENLKFQILKSETIRVDSNIINTKISYYEKIIESLFKKYVAIHSSKDPIYKKIDVLTNDFNLNKQKIIDYIQQQPRKK